MGIKERKERERDQRRELILDAAKEILEQEGIEGISIRKIANKIEYSPSVIYHYFEDKNEIVNFLMQEGYRKILEGLSSALVPGNKPEEQIKALLQRYIEAALAMPDQYKTVQLDSNPEVLKHTASLFEGAAAKKPALKILFQSLKAIYGDSLTNDNIELTAQVIASASFGLILRLILEKDIIPESQKSRLIEHHVNFILTGILKNANELKHCNEIKGD